MEVNTQVDLFGVKIIDSFSGEYRFLSNFALAAPIIYLGVAFTTSEHAYQWSKTTDGREKLSILYHEGHPSTPGQAKASGDAVTKRPDWDDIRDQVMLDIVRAKFTQNQHMKELLLATGDSFIIEGNWWHDCYWGKCNCPKHNGIGENRLGQILMQVRQELRENLS